MQAKPLFIRQPDEIAKARHRPGPDAALVRLRCLTRMHAIIQPSTQYIIEGREASVKNDGGTCRESNPFDRAFDFHSSLSGGEPKFASGRYSLIL
jgi:hypothetical protein